MEETDEYEQFLEEREIYRQLCRVSDEKIKFLIFFELNKN